jgi:hypothetical protein
MIIYKSRFLTRGEVWFDDAPTSERVDWIVYHQRSQPTPKGNWRPFYTRVIGLSQNPDELLAQMDGFTAADIKKARKKDGTVCQKIDAKNRVALNEFADFYDRFATLKHLGPADRHWLERTVGAGKLDVWAADSPQGLRHAYHVFYRDGRRARSLHAASFYAHASSKEAQREIGRANRLLIWECMLHYKGEGVEVFDLGGWYNGSTDTALLGVNKFKEGFGGKVICEYEGEQLKTIKAWGAVGVARLLKKWTDRKMRGAERAAAQPEVGAALGVRRQQPMPN